LSDIELSIKTKVESIGVPLKEWDVEIYRGVLTGYNDAFIINSEKRNEILENCADDDERERTAAIIRPILRGRDVARYRYNWADLWLINVHNGIKGKLDRIHIEDYPAIKQHLDCYWDKVMPRADQGDTPYNLRNCAYLDDFLKPKIIWKRVGSILRFSYDEKGLYGLDSTCFAVGEEIAYICCFLNSSMGHYLLNGAPRTGTGDLLISVQAVEPIKIPIIKPELNETFKTIIDKASSNPDAIIDEEVDNIIFSLYGLTEEEKEFLITNFRG
jgi:type II restriction/modification system DNA methylase subunit YeeA